MNQKKSKVVHVEHLNHNGIIKDRLIYGVDDCWFDDQYSIRGALITPAVRIIFGGGRDYAVVHLADPTGVVTRIKTSTGIIKIGLDDFQPRQIPDAQAFLLITEKYPTIHKGWWNTVFNKTKHIDQFWSRIQYDPRIGDPQTLELCARSLPTPSLPPGVTKLQYFKLLAQLSKT